MGLDFVLIFLSAAWAEERQLTLITVTGDAEVLVVPDRAIIQLGVQNWNKDLDKARHENDERIQNIIKRLKQFQIGAEDIQTGYFNLEPTYEQHYDQHNNPTQKVLTGYQVNKDLTVTLKDMGKFEEVFSTVAKDGANQIHGVDFKNSELRKYRDQARAMAIRAAKEKAEALAKEIGQHIGKACSISEEYIAPWYPRMQQTQNVQQSAGGGGAEGGAESSMAPGKISISARISVSFELL